MATNMIIQQQLPSTLIAALRKDRSYKAKYSELKKAQGMIRQKFESENPGISSAELGKLLNADEEYKKLNVEIKAFSKESQKFNKQLNAEMEQFYKSRIMVPIAHKNNPKLDPPFVRNSKSIQIPLRWDEEICADLGIKFADSIGGFICEDKKNGSCLNLIYCGDLGVTLWCGHSDRSNFSEEIQDYLNTLCFNMTSILKGIFNDRVMVLHGELVGPGIQDNEHKLDKLEFMLWDISDQEGNYLPSLRVDSRIKGSTVQSVCDRCKAPTEKFEVIRYYPQNISEIDEQMTVNGGASPFAIAGATKTTIEDLVIINDEQRHQITEIYKGSEEEKLKILIRDGFLINKRIGEGKDFELHRSEVLMLNKETREWKAWSGTYEENSRVAIPEPGFELVIKSEDIIKYFGFLHNVEGLVMKSWIAIKVGPMPTDSRNMVTYKVRHDTLTDEALLQLYPELYGGNKVEEVVETSLFKKIWNYVKTNFTFKK